jgi:hypothetical protein
MSLMQENRLKKAFSELPVKLKLKVLIDAYYKTGEKDVVLNVSITNEERKMIKKLLEKYSQLPFCYNEKLIYELEHHNLETRISWREQAKMTLSAVNLAISHLEMLIRLNFYSIQNKHLEKFCQKRKKRLLKLKLEVKNLIENINNLLVNKDLIENKLSQLKNEIFSIETELGFKYKSNYE